MVRVISVIGTGRMSGKTTTIESLVHELTARGYKVGTIKQIHETNFSIDAKGKDTWRHAEAGASIAVVAAPHEVCAIKRVKSRERFAEAMRFLEGEDLDLVLVEGNPPVDVPKIFVAGDPERARKILPNVRDVLCISSLSPEKLETADFKVPVLNSTKDIKKIADLLAKHLPERHRKQ